MKRIAWCNFETIPTFIVYPKNGIKKKKTTNEKCQQIMRISIFGNDFYFYIFDSKNGRKRLYPFDVSISIDLMFIHFQRKLYAFRFIPLIYVDVHLLSILFAFTSNKFHRRFFFSTLKASHCGKLQFCWLFVAHQMWNEALLIRYCCCCCCLLLFLLWPFATLFISQTIAGL